MDITEIFINEIAKLGMGGGSLSRVARTASDPILKSNLKDALSSIGGSNRRIVGAGYQGSIGKAKSEPDLYKMLQSKAGKKSLKKSYRHTAIEQAKKERSRGELRHGGLRDMLRRYEEILDVS